jgi:hypothetical protein
MSTTNPTYCTACGHRLPGHYQGCPVFDDDLNVSDSSVNGRHIDHDDIFTGARGDTCWCADPYNADFYHHYDRPCVRLDRVDL